MNDFGKIGFVMSVLAYFALVINFGYDTYGTREIASERKNADFIVSDILSVKVVLSFISFLLLVIVSFTLIPIDKTFLTILFGLTLITSVFNLSWYYQGVENMVVITKARFIEGACYLAGVLTFLIIFKSIFVIPIAFVIAQGISYFYYSKKLDIKFRISFNRIASKIFNLIKNTYAIGLSSFFILIYYNLDMIMLGYMKGGDDVGIYNAAVKIFLLCVLPFQLILMSFFPRLSKIGLTKTSEFKNNFFQYAMLMSITAIVLSWLLFLLSSFLVEFIFGYRYMDADLPLEIFSINVLVVGINMLIGNPLIAWGKQNRYLIAIGMGAISNVILNFILIPKFSYNGAAIATVLSEMIVFLGLIYFFLKYTSSIFFRRNA